MKFLLLSILILFYLGIGEAKAGIWNSCVLYNVSDDKGKFEYDEAISEDGATPIDDLSLFWLPDVVKAAIESGQEFRGVCIYVKPYIAGLPVACSRIFAEYRESEWHWKDQHNRPIYDQICVFKAELEHNLGYWTMKGEWIAYENPCKDYLERLKNGEKVKPEPSCEAEVFKSFNKSNSQK